MKTNTILRPLLAAALLTVAHLTTAQNDYPLPVSSNVTIDGGSINFKRPVTSGGWARGLFFHDLGTNPDKWAGIGLYGTASTPKDIYLGYGSSPWASAEGLHINDNGNVGVGVRFPSERLEVNGTSLFRNTSYFGTESSNRIGIVDYNDAQDLFLIRAAAGHKLSLGANDTNDRMVIDLDGNVGIGITNPEHKLHVKNTSSSYLRKGEIRFEVGYFGAPEGGTNKPNWIQSSYFNNSNWDLGLGGDDYNGKEPLMMIKGDGKVGVGTLSPSSHFAIETDDLSVFQAKSNRADGANVSKFVNDADRGLIFTSYGSEYSAGSYFGTGQNNGALAFNQPVTIGTVANDDLKFGTSGYARMTIHSSGKVGIGTFDPLIPERLYVAGGARVDSYLTLGANGNSSHTASGLILESHDDNRGTGTFSNGQTAEWFWGNPYTDHDGTFIIARGPQGTGKALAQKANALFTMTDNGNVSLGTTDVYTDFKLSVNGKIQTDEVKVHPETQWMDIVFEEDYDLRTLEEVNKYIEENGHLPDIPSAEEVEENGFSLGEMDANLLRKIEELTLYLLEKEREVTGLRSELKNMQADIDKLNEHISKTEELNKEVEKLRLLMLNKE